MTILAKADAFAGLENNIADRLRSDVFRLVMSGID
jgi:hypothetical protein